MILHTIKGKKTPKGTKSHYNLKLKGITIEEYGMLKIS